MLTRNPNKAAIWFSIDNQEHILEPNDGAYDDDDVPINEFAKIIGETYYDEDCAEYASYETPTKISDALTEFSQGEHILSGLPDGIVHSQASFIIIIYGHNFTPSRNSAPLTFAGCVDLKTPMFEDPR